MMSLNGCILAEPGDRCEPEAATQAAEPATVDCITTPARLSTRGGLCYARILQRSWGEGMLEIKLGHVVQGPRWPEPVDVKLVEDLGDNVRLVGAPFRLASAVRRSLDNGGDR